jgi:hypothetical protein
MGLVQLCSEAYVLIPGLETTKKLSQSGKTESEGAKKQVK